jgi:hypothetical protein
MPSAFSFMPPGFNPLYRAGQPAGPRPVEFGAITGQLYPAIILARIVTLNRPKE